MHENYSNLSELGHRSSAQGLSSTDTFGKSIQDRTKDLPYKEIRLPSNTHTADSTLPSHKYTGKTIGFPEMMCCKIDYVNEMTDATHRHVS